MTCLVLPHRITLRTYRPRQILSRRRYLPLDNKCLALDSHLSRTRQVGEIMKPHMTRLPSPREYDLLDFESKRAIVELTQTILFQYLATERGDDVRDTDQRQG